MKNKTAVQILMEDISYTSKDTYQAMKESGFFEKAEKLFREQIDQANFVGWVQGMTDSSDGNYYEKTWGK